MANIFAYCQHMAMDIIIANTGTDVTCIQLKKGWANSWALRNTTAKILSARCCIRIRERKNFHRGYHVFNHLNLLQFSGFTGYIVHWSTVGNFLGHCCKKCVWILIFDFRTKEWWICFNVTYNLKITISVRWVTFLLNIWYYRQTTLSVTV